VIGLFPQLVARISARVHTKLLVAFLGIVVMFAALGGVGLGVLHQSNERTDSLIRAQNKIAAYRLLQRNITEQLYTVSSVMLTTDDRMLEAAIRQINNSLYDFERARLLGSEDTDSLDMIEADYFRLIEVGTQIIELIREGKLAEAREYQKQHAIPLANRLERMTNALANRAEANMITSAESSKRGFVLSQYVVLGVALAAVLFALLLGYSISLSLIGPVRKMNQRFREIAQGNFAGSVDIENRDEMGDLAKSLNDMSRELGRLYREIQAASRHKSEFLANMSHELRTPLNAIIGFSEMLGEQVFGELNEKQAEYVRDIHESGEHLLSLINDILDLSKIEAGRMELDLKKFDVRVALENAVTLVKERSLRHGIKLEVDIDPRLDRIVADERKFKQIMLNLLSNAIKFTPEGGTIGVAAANSAENLEVQVSDTGIGIAPEDQGHIFEEFRQVTEDINQAHEGTGLGLTLTKKFVEMHGGSIEVQSQVNQGSRFTFSIPMKTQTKPLTDMNPDANVGDESNQRASHGQ
jgi:signal transduction histidine kinase